MIKSINGLEYGGKYHQYFWDESINLGATIDLALPDCTTFVLGDVLVDRGKSPVSVLRNAGAWHNYLANGWIAIPYEESKLKLGDIVEWSAHNHVARVSEIKKGEAFVSRSYYTGIHGKAYYNGSYDTRNFSSLRDLSDFMISNYPYRFFHFVNLDVENDSVGGKPNYILVMPLSSVNKDTSKNQIQVLTNEQYVRDENDEIISGCEKGYYNVLSTKQLRGYTWYEVEKDKFIAGVNGRVIYLPKESKKQLEQEIADLTALLKDYEKRLNKINSLSEVNDG